MHTSRFDADNYNIYVYCIYTTKPLFAGFRHGATPHHSYVIYRHPGHPILSFSVWCFPFFPLPVLLFVFVSSLLQSPLICFVSFDGNIGIQFQFEIVVEQKTIRPGRQSNRIIVLQYIFQRLLPIPFTAEFLVVVCVDGERKSMMSELDTQNYFFESTSM